MLPAMVALATGLLGTTTGTELVKSGPAACGVSEQIIVAPMGIRIAVDHQGFIELVGFPGVVVQYFNPDAKFEWSGLEALSEAGILHGVNYDRDGGIKAISLVLPAEATPDDWEVGRQYFVDGIFVMPDGTVNLVSCDEVPQDAD